MTTPSDPSNPSGEPARTPPYGPGPKPGYGPGPNAAYGPGPKPAFEPGPNAAYGPGPKPAQEPGHGRASEFTPRRRIFSLKRILLVLLGLFLFGVAGLVVAFAMVSVPPPNALANAQASIIYYAGGRVEMARISEVNRESVPLDQVPLHVRHALLAAEDRSFETNNGVSPSGIARSLMVALKGGPTQGGSTITQQYVKNYFLTQDRTISRKAKEFIISIKIDQQETKDTILINYLNTIYYGRGAYGIQTAAKAYFGHDASKLTVAEGALLASVIRGPSFYDPGLGATQKAAVTQRMKYVLDGMVTQGWLTPAERAKASVFPRIITRTKIVKTGPTGYLTNEVKRELGAKLNLSKDAIDRGGLRIVTTINKKAQDSAVRAVAENMPSSNLRQSDPKALHVGLTAIRPGDGAIIAMYGGKDYGVVQYNSSTDATLQAGSTFKAFGMLAAGQKGISTKTTYKGYSPQYFPQFVGPGEPKGKVSNFANESYGRITLRTALADSVNTVFAQLNIDLANGGTKAVGVRDAAVLAGVPKNTSGLEINMNNIFGTASPHVIDMANAYATIAAQGIRATPYIISSVKFADGKNEYTATKKVTRAFDRNVTADVTDAMQRVVTEGTATKAKALGRPAAGKTGTATANKAVWFDGFTPQLAAAVGIYQGDGTGSIKVKGVSEVTGATYSVKIWTAFMEGALKGVKVVPFPPRVGLGDSKLPPPPPIPTQTPSPTPTPSHTTPTHTPGTPQPTRSHPTGQPTQTHPTGPPGPGPGPTAPPTALPGPAVPPVALAP